MRRYAFLMLFMPFLCCSCGSLTDRFALPASKPELVQAVIPQVLESADLDRDGWVRTAEEQATFSLLLRIAVATTPPAK